MRSLALIGIHVDRDTGHINYADHFQPLKVDFELVFLRHGETYGNCGQVTSDGKIDFLAVENDQRSIDKRIFQGNVDTEINQLTEKGKQQAYDAALALETQLLAKGWQPDLIFHSPLARAKETGMPFVTRNNLHDRYHVLKECHEMSYGAWENKRICDLHESEPCHLIYLQQHALIKNGETESFYDVMLRAYNVLKNLEHEHTGKKIIIFSHSIFGGACEILFGRGQLADDGTHIAFDGKRKTGEPYTIPHAVPILMNVFKPQTQ